MIIPGPQLTKLLESFVGLGPRRNGIVRAIPPLDLPCDHLEVLLAAAHHANSAALQR